MFNKLMPVALACAISAAFIFVLVGKTTVAPATADEPPSTQEQVVDQNATTMVSQGETDLPLLVFQGRNVLGRHAQAA